MTDTQKKIAVKKMILERFDKGGQSMKPILIALVLCGCVSYQDRPLPIPVKPEVFWERVATVKGRWGDSVQIKMVIGKFSAIENGSSRYHLMFEDSTFLQADYLVWWAAIPYKTTKWGAVWYRPKRKEVR